MHWSEVKAKNRVDPKYPPAARDMHLEGDCKIRINIDEKGKPFDAQIVACPKPFEEAALLAANSSSFYPMKVEGKAVKATFLFTYKFKLSG